MAATSSSVTSGGVTSGGVTSGGVADRRLARMPGRTDPLVFRIANHQATSRHDHVFHEIVYVEAGAADHRTVQGVQPLRPGDLIVIRPQIWHAYERPRGLCIYNCLFTVGRLRQFDPWMGKLDSALDLFRRRPTRDEAPVLLHASPAQRQGIHGRLNTLMAELQHQEPGWHAAAAANLLDLLVTISRLHQRQPNQPPLAITDRTHLAVLEAVSYLEAHFDRPVSLAQLAKMTHVSPGHLCRSFRKSMGMGTVEFIHRLRAEEACRLLRLTDMLVHEIASRVGYDEVAYFSRSFRRQVGMSPRQYRNEHPNL